MNYSSHGASSSDPDDLRLSEPELSLLAEEMRRVWHAVASGVSHTGRMEGLQRQQIWLLTALTGGPRKMSALAECAQTSQTSLTGIVDRLEERGLVERVRSAEDRRVVEVALTEVGRSETRAAKLRMLKRLDHVLEPLDEHDKAELFRIMKKINKGQG